MANPANEPATAKWSTANVYLMAGVCLAIGLVLGYLFRGSETRSTVSASVAPATSASAPSANVPAHTLSMAQMKQMADKKAAPLLAKLQNDPRNAELLVQVAGLYGATHQFDDAVGYYKRALEVDPKNVSTRTEMASSMYYSGDIDGAVAQLQQSLSYDPKNANALFNLGMIKWKGKNDAAGAIAAWQTLLKTNPKLDRKPVVEKMIAEAKLGSGAVSPER
jgi:cytochrome c-type biogenesis protein CcmH/NrfG